MITDPKKLSKHLGLKYYTPFAMLFVAVLIITNIITQKIVPIGFGLILTAGDFIYPITYIISMILTEVYGYALSRRVIWCGLACNLLIVGVVKFAIFLPAATIWTEQAQFANIIGRTTQLVFASFTAFVVGEFLNTYILAKLKVFTEGKYLWMRGFAATLIGQAIDSTVFTCIAFWHILHLHDAIVLNTTVYVSKILYLLVLTPLIYWLARFLKKHEGVDIYDTHTNFNPFNLGV